MVAPVGFPHRPPGRQATATAMSAIACSSSLLTLAHARAADAQETTLPRRLGHLPAQRHERIAEGLRVGRALGFHGRSGSLKRAHQAVAGRPLVERRTPNPGESTCPVQPRPVSIGRAMGLGSYAIVAVPVERALLDRARRAVAGGRRARRDLTQSWPTPGCRRSSGASPGGRCGMGCRGISLPRLASVDLELRGPALSTL